MNAGSVVDLVTARVENRRQEEEEAFLLCVENSEHAEHCNGYNRESVQLYCRVLHRMSSQEDQSLFSLFSVNIYHFNKDKNKKTSREETNLFY